MLSRRRRRSRLASGGCAPDGRASGGPACWTFATPKAAGWTRTCRKLTPCPCTTRTARGGPSPRCDPHAGSGGPRRPNHRRGAPVSPVRRSLNGNPLRPPRHRRVDNDNHLSMGWGKLLMDSARGATPHQPVASPAADRATVYIETSKGGEIRVDTRQRLGIPSVTDPISRIGDI